MIMMTVIRVMTLVGLTWSITEFQPAEVGLNINKPTFLTPKVHLSSSGKARKIDRSIPSESYRLCSRTAHDCTVARQSDAIKHQLI
jgi:hypothetical protein